MSERKPHPSGRPVRREARKSLSIMRPPGEGPYLPRLQPRGGLTDAIGFTAHLDRDESEGESE
jgi:hypothetical protein